MPRMQTLDPDDHRPSYRQIADRLRTSIESGTLAPGDQLPTHKALSDEYGVAIETAKRALAELRSEGLIVSRQGKGSYVRHLGDNEAIGDDLRAQVADLTRQMESVQQRLAALEESP